MKTNKIACTCGIFYTSYTIRDYGKHAVITEPYIKWAGNSGSLAFRKTRIDNEKQLSIIRQMIDADTLCVEINGVYWVLSEMCK